MSGGKQSKHWWCSIREENVETGESSSAALPDDLREYNFRSLPGENSSLGSSDNAASNSELFLQQGELNLEEGLTFISWEQAKLFFDNFALQEGFSYRIRRSESEDGIVTRLTYECTKSGKHNPQITTDPTKHHNVHSQKTECHGILIFLFQSEMVPQFQKLTSSMLKDIKKYVVKGRKDSASIYPLLINDYPQNTINKRDLYNAVYNIRQQNNPGRKCGKCRRFGHYANTFMD
ncbi:12870_t:CDS:2 [Entrophospora sp. SA101]|nr:12870_t:CDS:2 [Entrophospora sp. SA101]